MKRISSLLLAMGLIFALAAPAGAYEAFKGFLGVLQNDQANATPGYILNCPYDSKVTYLMDKDGNVVNEWFSEYVGFYAELLPNGNMARHSRMAAAKDWTLFGGSCGLIEEFDWEGNIVWTHEIYVPGNVEGAELSHHTFEVMPNGNYMILVWQYHSLEEAIAKGLDTNDAGRVLFPDGFRQGNGNMLQGIWPDIIREVNRNHETVWEFSVWDNTSNVDNYYGWNINKYLPAAQSRSEAGPDWTHCNGVAYNPRTNQVVFTSRAQGEFIVLDYATKQIVYRWGNPYNWGGGVMSQGYGDDGDQILFGPHAPDWTPDNTITVLHNATNRPSGANTGFYEVDPAIDPKPNNGKDALIFAWGSENVGVQKGTYYSSHQSGVQKLANGHYLLTLTTGGSTIEIMPDKSIVWEFVNPVLKDQIYYTSSGHGQTGDGQHRAMFYAPDWPGFAGKDLSRVLYSLPNWVDMLRLDPVPRRAPS